MLGSPLQQALSARAKTDAMIARGTSRFTPEECQRMAKWLRTPEHEERYRLLLDETMKARGLGVLPLLPIFVVAGSAIAAVALAVRSHEQRIQRELAGGLLPEDLLMYGGIAAAAVVGLWWVSKGPAEKARTVLRRAGRAGYAKPASLRSFASYEEE